MIKTSGVIVRMVSQNGLALRVSTEAVIDGSCMGGTAVCCEHLRQESVLG